MPLADEIVQLRKALRERRNALGDAEQEAAAGRLLQQLMTLDCFRQSRSLALYLANDGEIDPVHVKRWCLEQGVDCYLPVILEGEINRLGFAPVTRESRFRPNRFGIEEPDVGSAELLAGDQLDLVLLPLVGFDDAGHRIGMGGGFYDATFAFKKADPATRPHLVGLAHEVQRVDKIEVESWDVPLSAVVTGDRVYQA